MRQMKLGLQLYNFRNELKSDFRGTLETIAELGFDGVEFAGNYGKMPPEELAALLRKLDLECAGAMFSREQLEDCESDAYGYAEALRTPAVTFSLVSDFALEWQSLVEPFQKIGQNAKSHGTVFSYHNHWWEFPLVEGEYALSRVLDETDGNYVFLEPDVCWMHRGGVDASEYIGKYADRIVQIHLKDICKPDEPLTTTELGRGVVDLTKVCRAARNSSCRWLIYEQDNSSLGALESAKISLKTMKDLLTAETDA
ncbi:MAG: sugar phosphate isomerase/epimerase [Victivallaceae bacterium]|nr:sugar phosphate isomerase/epimerase [Victivallaceae bacterium]